MICKKITSQVKQSSLDGFEAIAFVDKKFSNMTFSEGNGGIIVEKLYVIDKKDRDGLKGEDTFYLGKIGKTAGDVFFNEIRIEWAVLYDEAKKGNTKLSVRRASIGGYGEDLKGLVTRINREVKGEYHQQYGGLPEDVYGITGIKSVKDMTAEPAGFTPKMVRDYVEEMRPYLEKKNESMSGRKTKAPARKQNNCGFKLNFRGML